MLGALIAGKRTEREILGSEGVLGELTRRLVERALREELSEHLGYPAGQAPPGGAGNSRNGGTPKTLLTDQGRVAIDVPHGAAGRFEPQLVGKHQRRLAGLDEKIIALYAGGVTTREIETYIAELYGPGVSRETVSRVTASVLEDAEGVETRPLEAIYPTVYLDALVIKIRDGQAVRQLLLLYRDRGEPRGRARRARHVVSAHRGRQVLAAGPDRPEDPRRPGRPLCCVDGLTGSRRRSRPSTRRRGSDCIVHAIRAALKFCLQGQEEGRRGPAQDLHGGGPRRARTRGVRRDLGREVSDDLRLVDRELGADRPVRGVPARGPPRGLPTTRSRRSTARSARSSRPAAAPPRRTPPASCSTSRSPEPNRNGGTPTTGAQLSPLRIHFGDRIPPRHRLTVTANSYCHSLTHQGVTVTLTIALTQKA